MEEQFNKKSILELAHRIKIGTATDSEIEQYNAWYNTKGFEILELPREAAPNPLAIRDRMYDIIMETVREDKAERKKTVPLWTKLVAVASILFITGVLFKVNQHHDKIVVQEATAINVAPGSNKATLTLSDGKRITLTDASNGAISQQAGVQISKTADGRVVYEVRDPGLRRDDEGALNTIETPKGGQYQVRLPDGSEVWLNAASKLTYPVSLTERGQREVTLIGEAYFQVAKDKAHPFIVKSAGQQVEVLGTHFNVNSYADEGRIVTTLEEGSVKVTTGSKDKIIKPGQQTLVSSNHLIQVQQADLQTALAWKDNKLSFEDAGIQQIMRQVSRWYDLQIEYRGPIPKDTFTGTINRQSNLSTVLEMFKSSAINFSLEPTPTGKKLIIKP